MIRIVLISYQVPRGRVSPYHSNNASIHPTQSSFTDETSRCALLQLGDILQSLPEVYILLIIHGGGEIWHCVEALRQSLDVSNTSASSLTSHPGILMKIRSLLICHAIGSRFMSNYTQMVCKGWDLREKRVIERAGSDIDFNFYQFRRLFIPFLM